MIDERMACYYVNGTSALDLQRWHETGEKATIIPFPRREDRNPHIASSSKQEGATVKNRISNLLASSEMYCSLKLEDFRGCRYGIFTRQGIAALSTGTAVLAIISLVVGA